MWLEESERGRYVQLQERRERKRERIRNANGRHIKIISNTISVYSTENFRREGEE
jgi:hypothetical protein